MKTGAVPRLGIVGQTATTTRSPVSSSCAKGENASEVLKGVKAKMAELNERGLPPVRIVPFYDRTWLMEKTWARCFRNLVEGALLVSLVLYLFLSNLRASLAVVVVIPLSLLSTFMGLKVLGVPANLLSLGAMDFGIIVDGAVIVVENIAPPGRARRGHGRNATGATPSSAPPTKSGRPRCSPCSSSSRRTFPIFALQRHEGRIFQPMALSVTMALVGSLIFSLTLVPLLAYWMLKRRLPHGDNRVVRGAKSPYAPVLDWALAHQRKVLAMALLAFGATGLVASRLARNSCPS